MAIVSKREAEALLDVDRSKRYKQRVSECPPDDPICTKCLKEYGSNPRAMTKWGPALAPQCSLSASVLLKAAAESDWWPKLTKQEQADYQIAKDPVLWAGVNLRNLQDLSKPWTPEFYQIEPLRCSAKRILLRYGRQLGKCPKSLTLLDLGNGARVPVEDLEGKVFDILSMAGYGQTTRKATVTKDQIKSCVRVEFESGKRMEVSTDHPFRAFDRWVDANKLVAGDRIASMGRGVFGSTSMPDEEAEALGLAIADGGLTRRCFNFTKSNPIIIERLRQIAEYYGCHLHAHRVSGQYTVTRNDRHAENPAVAVLLKHGVFGKLSKHKTIPPSIFIGTKRVVSLFLSRLFGCDGWASVDKGGSPQVGYCSASEPLARGVQALLIKFGIYSVLYKKKARCGGKEFEAWQLLISCGEDLRRFASEIGMLGKEEALQAVISAIRPPADNERSARDTLPKEARLLAKKALNGRPERQVCPDIRIWRNRGLARRVARELADLTGSEELRMWADSDIIWDTVVSVTPIGEHQTYSVSILDAETYDDANFFAEGICTHNTEAICVRVLYKMDTNPGYKIILVAPSQSQTSMIYNRLSSFIDTSETLRSRESGRCSSPHYEIRFVNQSYVRLFTAGVQAGRKGDNVRGQTADTLVLDEADLLNDAVINSIFATMSASAGQEVLVSSTPTGRRGKFYSWATDPMQGYRSLHYPSRVGPRWNPEMEFSLRATHTSIQFAQEYEAEFGEMQAGVFKAYLIDAPGVIQDYDCYDNAKPLPGEVYILGVDWNDKGIGGVLIIQGFNPKTLKFRIAKIDTIDPAKFTQIATVQRIIALNDEWNFYRIYVDKGWGNTQVEILQKYGLENRETGLHKKVHGIPMHGKISIKNPLSGKMEPKIAKELMVEIACSRLEGGLCILPRSENHRRGLIGQMREYQTKVMPSGRKVFVGTDHLLTSWMLGMLGITVEADIAQMKKFINTIVQLDDNLELLDKRRKEEILKEEIDKRKRLSPKTRTKPRNTLTFGESIEYAKTGLPDKVRNRLERVGLEQLQRGGRFKRD